jgi:hypothetical protein
MVLEQPGKLELVFTPKDGGDVKRFEVYDFKGSGGWQRSGAAALHVLPLLPLLSPPLAAARCKQQERMACINVIGCARQGW